MKRCAVDVRAALLLASLFSLASWAVGVERDYRDNVRDGFPSKFSLASNGPRCAYRFTVE